MTAREPLTKASASAGADEGDDSTPLSEDLMAAIDNRITWMVESIGIIKSTQDGSSGRSLMSPRLTNLISVDPPPGCTPTVEPGVSGSTLPLGSFAL